MKLSLYPLTATAQQITCLSSSSSTQHGPGCHPTCFKSVVAGAESALHRGEEAMVFPIGILVSTFCAAVDLLSVIFFKLAAFATVFAIKALRVPGVLASQVLEQVAQAFDSASGIIVETVTEFVTSAVSSVFEILVELITGTVDAGSSGVVGLVEMTKGALAGLPELVGELIQDLFELVCSVSSVWNNFWEAVSYVQEQVQEQAAD